MVGTGVDGPKTGRADPGRALRLVSTRLPQVRDGVARLFERDGEFRDLCGRYAATLAAPGAEDFFLEGELLVYLAEHQPVSS